MIFRRCNRVFRITDREVFVARLLQDVPPRPPNAELIRTANLSVAHPALRRLSR